MIRLFMKYRFSEHFADYNIYRTQNASADFVEETCKSKSAKNRSDVTFEDVEDHFVSNEVDEDYSVQEEYVEGKVEEAYRAPVFDGKAGITARTRLPAKRFDIWAEVSAVCGEGTLISSSGMRDHMWLGFVGDRVVLRWDAGSGPMELRSRKVKLDSRTKISARRYKKDAVLKLGSVTVRGSAPGRMSSLDVDPFIYVGHPPENVTRSMGVTSLLGFVGCVHRLRVSGRDVIPPARGLSVTSHGLRPCTPHNLAWLVCP